MTIKQIQITKKELNTFSAVTFTAGWKKTDLLGGYVTVVCMNNSKSPFCQAQDPRSQIRLATIRRCSSVSTRSSARPRRQPNLPVSAAPCTSLATSTGWAAPVAPGSTYAMHTQGHASFRALGSAPVRSQRQRVRQHPLHGDLVGVQLEQGICRGPMRLRVSKCHVLRLKT